MKILLINTLADMSRGGGAEAIVWEQMHAFGKAGLQPVLLATQEEPGLHRTELQGCPVWLAGVRNLYWPFDGQSRSMWKRMAWHAIDMFNPWMQSFVREVVRREKPDIAVVHNLAGWSSATWRTLKRLGVPSVQVLHDNYSLCVKSTMFKAGHNCTGQCLSCRTFRLPHRRLSRHVNAVVGVSRFVIDRHFDAGYFKDVPLHEVIHNVRRGEEFTHNGPGIDNNRPLRYGFIGKLDPIKGIDYLIEVFKKDCLPESELLVAGAGDPDFTEALKREADGHPIRFLGRQRASYFYSQIDVLVVPSIWHDTLPTVVIEALLSGLPVVASNRGGIPEMIQHERNGLLFDPDKAGSLASALRRIREDEVMRRRLVSNTQRSGWKYADIQNWATYYETLCRVVVEDAPPRATPTSRHALSK